jgi:hypothetical protein
MPKGGMTRPMLAILLSVYEVLSSWIKQNCYVRIFDRYHEDFVI